MTSPDIGHLASVVAVLLAGDVQARVATNGEHPSIIVTSEGDRIIWGNEGPTWAFTMVTREGMTIGGPTSTPSGVPAEQAAQLIAQGVQV